MRKLDEVRMEIDRIDEELLRLLARRVQLMKEVAKIKIESGGKMVDLSRESKIVEKVRKVSLELGVNPDLMELLFRTIMLVCLKEEVMYVEECGSDRRCRKDG
ncbi:MAG: chorismate mutase [Sulfolobales archaeon]